MLKGIDRNAGLNAASGFLAGYGWIAFFCFLCLVEHWAHISPRTADPAHGYVFPHNEHGSITYFSAFQGTSCALLFSTSIPLFFLAIAICPKRNVISRTNRFSFSMKWDRDDPRGWGPVAAACGAIAAPLIVFLIGPALIVWLNSIGFVTGF